MGTGSIKLFRIAGIQLEVHLTFLLFGLLFAAMGVWSAGLLGLIWFTLFLLAIFTCVVLHELGHCLVARSYDIGVSRILLLPVGGMAQFERIPREPHQEISISLAGPMVNIVLATILLLIGGLPQVPAHADTLPLNAITFIQGLLIINVIMAVFNLLPIFPMDGGRVLRAILATRFSYLHATSVAAKIAKVLAVIAIVVAIFKYTAPLPAILFAIVYVGGDLEYRMVKRREKTNGLFVGDLVAKNYLTIESDRLMGEALEIFLAYRPSEILVVKNGVPHGILTGRVVRRAQRRGWLDHPVQRHTCRKLTVLQAGWPLDPFVEMISHSRQRLYPVYSFGDLVGVLDTRNLENMIAWKRLEERSESSLSFRE